MGPSDAGALLWVALRSCVFEYLKVFCLFVLADTLFPTILCLVAIGILYQHIFEGIFSSVFELVHILGILTALVKEPTTWIGR